MKIHTLIQGSPEWLAYRLEHDNASEAAAMFGLSKTTTRTELLHMKHTGISKEFSDWVQRNVLDYGHAVEGKVRPLIETMVGEDLYPVTCSEGRLSASVDGLTMSEEIAFECKQWNAEIAAQVAAGTMPEQHMPQCQQILMVTGAKKIIFAVGDGTPENLLTLDVYPDPAWFSRIRAGWAQFHKDRAVYVPAMAAVAVVAAPVQALPAVLVQVSGEIVVKDNFAAFETALREFLDHRLIREPKTDQDFADLDTQIKAMKGAEAALDACESQMLAQVQPVDQAKKTKDMLGKLVRDNRLMAEKLLASEKDRRKAEIVMAGRTAYDEHIAALTKETGGPWIVLMTPDFVGKVKGLRTIATMQDAVDTELARAKIVADESARSIRASLSCLKDDGAGYEFLFQDRLALIGKPVDDLKLLVKSRIDAHKAAELQKEEETRERIRKEEQAKATAEAGIVIAQAAAPETMPPTPEGFRGNYQRVWAAPEAGASGVVSIPSSGEDQQDDSARINLGAINEHLAPIKLDAAGLEQLGFVPVAIVKASKQYRSCDLPAIRRALTEHLSRLSELQVA